MIKQACSNCRMKKPEKLEADIENQSYWGYAINEMPVQFPDLRYFRRSGDFEIRKARRRRGGQPAPRDSSRGLVIRTKA